MKVVDFYNQLKNIYDKTFNSKEMKDVKLMFYVKTKSAEVEGEFIPPGAGTYDEPPENFAKDFTYYIGGDWQDIYIDGLKLVNGKVETYMYIIDYEDPSQNSFDYVFDESDYLTIEEILKAFKTLKLNGNENLTFIYNGINLTIKSIELKNNVIEFNFAEEVDMSDEMYEKLADEKYESALDNHLHPDDWYDDDDDE